MRRLRADAAYAKVEARAREEARLRAQIDEVLQPTAPDPVAAVLERLDARQHPRLKGPVKVRHSEPQMARKPGRVA